MNTLKIPAIASPFLYIEVKAQDLLGAIVNAQNDTVEVAFLEDGTEPDVATDFTAGTWLVVGNRAYATIQIGTSTATGVLATGVWWPWLKITHGAEIIVLPTPNPIRVV